MTTGTKRLLFVLAVVLGPLHLVGLALLLAGGSATPLATALISDVAVAGAFGLAWLA